ncbi:hypothetical protein GF312_18750 [Candidatus Poribacteria bacterium]|nr:hypothetical protein [Candidatus Poribacteria bacterium]
MATDFHFDFRDIFRAGRSGFKGKKMMMHFLGLMMGYVIYEILTYLSLIGSGAVREFWDNYGLRPVFFIAGKLSIQLPLITLIAMGIGIFIWCIIYYIFTTAVSKVAIEELRGDEFYSMKEAIKFSAKNWKSIFVAMIALIGIFLFCIFWPALVGILDLIPGVEQAAEHFGAPLTTFLTIPVYFIGLFLILLIVAFLVGLFLIPSIVAVTGEDTFETVYQLFSVIWNQPWRLLIYECILFIIKIVQSVIFAVVSFAGMYLAFLPSMLLAKQDGVYYFANVIARSLKIIGLDPDMVLAIIPNAKLGVNNMPWTLDVATFFLFCCLIMIAAIILSYPLSIMSSGYTIIYVVLRKRTTEENMLDIEEEDFDFEYSDEDSEDEENAEEEDSSDSGTDEN